MKVLAAIVLFLMVGLLNTQNSFYLIGEEYQKQIYMVKIFSSLCCLLCISNLFFLKLILLLLVFQVIWTVIQLIGAFIPLMETIGLFKE